MDSIISDNAACLRQGLDLLERLDDATYQRAEPLCFNSSIGGHLRHNADHYQALLDGLAEARVDYDHRQRDPKFEQSTAHAHGVLMELSERLGGLAPADLDRSVAVKMETGTSSEAVWATSSLRRELQFVLSHTVHHYALVATICRLQKVDVPAQFGVAPSTQKHLQAQAAS